MMTRALFPIAVAAMALSACDQAPAPNTADAPVVTVTDAVCRPTAKGRQVTGCYLTLTAGGDDTLFGVASPVAARGQIHETRMESNMMMMRELETGLPLPAGQAVALAPGGNHIMLLGVGEPLAAGDTVPLILTFATARPVEITATVGQPATADDHAGH